MLIESDESTDNSVEEGNGGVQEDTAVADVEVKSEEATPKKKAPVKRKRKTATSKRRRPAVKPAPPPPPPITLQELKQQGVQAKQEIVSAVVEPALAAAGSLSQTIRDTIGGALSGLLSRKRRD
tara:strand:+ start:454 stop:825 length:372 start_codon:yes stop_codon:yes gene_type:complete